LLGRKEDRDTPRRCRDYPHLSVECLRVIESADVRQEVEGKGDGDSLLFQPFNRFFKLQEVRADLCLASALFQYLEMIRAMLNPPDLARRILTDLPADRLQVRQKQE